MFNRHNNVGILIVILRLLVYEDYLVFMDKLVVLRSTLVIALVVK